MIRPVVYFDYIELCNPEQIDTLYIVVDEGFSQEGTGKRWMLNPFPGFPGMVQVTGTLKQGDRVIRHIDKAMFHVSDICIEEKEA